MKIPFPPSPLALDLRRPIVRRGLLAPGDRVLVAVSGGADSLALAGILDELAQGGFPMTLIVAHLDHGWRGPRAAAADRDAVEALCIPRGLELRVAGPPTRPVPSEAAARRWRYGALGRIAADVGARRIATGHHAGDQAETVLLRLARGSGLRGLAGIPWRRRLGAGPIQVVRPLLEVAPTCLRAWLTARGLAWVEDPTNRDPSRDRARARAALRAAPAGQTARLLAFAARQRTRLERREREVVDRLTPALRHRPLADAVDVDRAALLALSPRLLDIAVHLMGRALSADRDGPYLTRRHVRLLEETTRTGGAVDLPRGLAWRVGPRRVTLYRRQLDPAPALPGIGRVEYDREGFDLPAFLATRRAWEAAFDADRLGREVTVRRALPGDTFLPFRGPHRRPAPLFAWLARQGVAPWLRPRLAVVLARGTVAWIPGYREAQDTAVTSGTRRVAVLTLPDPARSAWGSTR